MPDAVVRSLQGTLRDVESIAGITGGRKLVSRRILSDLRVAQSRLAQRLRKDAKTFGALDSRFTSAQAVVYQRQIQLQIQYVQFRLRGYTKAQAMQAVQRSLRRTATIVERMERRFAGVYSPAAVREPAAMRTAINGARASLLRSMPTALDRYGEAMTGRFELFVRLGIHQGLTAEDMIGALTGHGGPTGRVSLAAKVTPDGVIRLREVDIPEGLFVRHRYWAERIVRTESMKSYNSARMEGLREQKRQWPDLQKKIIAILDDRTAPDSIAVNGQIRNLDDEFVDGAGRRYQFPPARPNDRETVIPWRPRWTEPAQAVKSTTERALLGELSESEEDALIARLKARKKRAKVK